jgi:hypothetical protein
VHHGLPQYTAAVPLPSPSRLGFAAVSRCFLRGTDWLVNMGEYVGLLTTPTACRRLYVCSKRSLPSPDHEHNTVQRLQIVTLPNGVALRAILET